MEELNYTSTKIFTRNKQGELIEKRVKAAQVCPGLLVTPEKSGMVDLIIEYNGIKWREISCGISNQLPRNIKLIPGILNSIAEGRLNTLDDYHKEMHRRIFNPDAPAVMELKKPERKPKQPKMNMDGTIRAKVLQYKADGNTLTEKWETLTKFSEGIYYGQNYAYFIFERNGVYWHSLRPDRLERIEERRQDIKADYTNFESSIVAAANGNRFIGKLQIEVMKRLGHDVAPLLASREAYLKQREEEERRKTEEAEQREREAKEAEEKRNAELLADGKKRLLEHKAVTVEQIELLAESVGYKINIRTIGFMREKVTEAALMEDGRVTVWGHKLTDRNIDGTCKILHEIAGRLKAQAEEEAQQAAESSQISTETAKPENVSANDEITAETANLRPAHVCDIQSDETWSKDEAADICNYISWLGSYDQDCDKHNHYFTIAEKALAEAPPGLMDEAIHTAPEQPPEAPPPEHREKSPPH